MADETRFDTTRTDPTRSDPSRGAPTAVHGTPIYTDDRGRRRRGTDLTVEPFPAVHDDPTKELLTRVAALENLLAGYMAKNDARVITGGGSAFSGTLGSGIKFVPAPTGGGSGIFATNLLPVTFCDGTTADLLAQNVVPGP